MIAKGSRIVARDDCGAWDPSSGQCLFDWREPNEREVAPRPRVDAPRNEADRDGGESPPIELLDPAELLELGLVLHERGDAARAASLYERAACCERAPLVAVTAYFNLGVAREDLGDPVGALQAYRAALELDPRCADAHYNAARLCELAGDQVGALRHLRAYSTCPSR